MKNNDLGEEVRARSVQIGPDLKVDSNLVNALKQGGRQVKIGDATYFAALLDSSDYNDRMGRDTMPLSTRDVPPELGGGTVVLFQV